MKVKVGINGYGTIGKRVATAVNQQDDMEIVGVTKTRPTYEAKLAVEKYPLYVPAENVDAFKEAGIKIAEPSRTSTRRWTSSSTVRPVNWPNSTRPSTPQQASRRYGRAERTTVSPVSHSMLQQITRSHGEHSSRVSSHATPQVC